MQNKLTQAIAELVHYTKTKEHRGRVRFWAEGVKLEKSGFPCGAPYVVTEYPELKKVELARVNSADIEGARLVSSCKRNGKARPIIDLNVSSVFDSGDRLKVVMGGGKIVITIHHEEQNKESREEEFTQRAASGMLREASLFTGGGVSTEAIHSGIESLGFESNVVWIAECEKKYIDAAGENCLSIDDNTAFLIGTVEEIENQYFTKADILSFSLPCAGFSKAGKAKHKKTSEEHSGTSLFGTVNAIRSANPAVCISENVVEAKDSPIYQLLTWELERLGYKVFEQVLDQTHTDTIEQRRRFWMVAISEGIAPESVQLDPVGKSGRQIAEILAQDIAPEMWCDNFYLKDKALRDEKAGKGFKRQLLTGDETSCGTIGRFYAKKRSTEPFITRADGKERLLTPAEHARVKSIPEHLIENVSTTTAHEILGQSVDFKQPFLLARETMQAIFSMPRTVAA